MARLVCVVGAGTGVGKTFVACGLLRAAVARGIACRGLKPIESGVDGVALDAAALGAAAGTEVPPRVALRAPVSPHRAARIEGMEIDLEEVGAWVRARAEGLTVVETAGGLLSPLTDRGETNLDLCAALAPVVVVAVAVDELGALHQVGSLVLALRTRGLDERVVVALSERGAGEGLDNAGELERLGIAPRVVGVPSGLRALLDAILAMA